MVVGGVALGCAPVVRAQVRTVNIAFYGTIPQPVTYLVATGQLQKALQGLATVTTMNVGAGPQILSGMASGQIDLGQLGMPPMVTGFANGLDISMVYMGRIQDVNEALVVHPDSGIKTIVDLRGKTIGVPYNTEVHYALLKTLQRNGMKPSDANILNVAPNSTYAAFQRKEIHATYIWSPILDQIKSEKAVVISSARDLRDAGEPLFEGFVAANQFKQKNPDLVVAYLKEVERAHKLFRDRSPEVVSVLTKYLNLPAAVVESYVSVYETVPVPEMVTDRWMGSPGASGAGVAKALGEVGDYLAATKQIKAAPASFSKYVDSSFASKVA